MPIGVNQTEFLKYRKEFENNILSIMKDLDKDEKGFNVLYWKNKFEKMNNNEFYEYVKKIANNFEDNIYYQLNTLGKEGSKDPEPEELIKYAKKRGIELKEYVIMPMDNMNNPSNPSVTRNKIPIFIVPVRKHQQTKDKKNSISSNTDKINVMTGQAIDESKAGKMTDNEVISLIATGQKDVIKEFLGPRGDDPIAHSKMIKEIMTTGKTRLSSLELKTDNKRSIKTMKDFLKAAGLDVSF